MCSSDAACQTPATLRGILDSPGKLSRITSITTVGTGIAIRFEPADALLALVTALRTGNLDSFFLEHGGVGVYTLLADQAPSDQAESDLQRTTWNNVMEPLIPYSTNSSAPGWR
jgi:hypothetical protein